MLGIPIGVYWQSCRTLFGSHALCWSIVWLPELVMVAWGPTNRSLELHLLMKALPIALLELCLLSKALVCV